MHNVRTGGTRDIEKGTRVELASWRGTGPACLYVSLDVALYTARATAQSFDPVTEELFLSIVETHHKEVQHGAVPQWQRRQMPFRGFAYPFLADELHCYAEFVSLGAEVSYSDKYPVAAGIVEGRHERRVYQCDYSAILQQQNVALAAFVVPPYCRQFRTMSSAPGTISIKSCTGTEIYSLVADILMDWKPLPLAAAYLYYTPVIGTGGTTICDRPIIEFRE